MKKFLFSKYLSYFNIILILLCVITQIELADSFSNNINVQEICRGVFFAPRTHPDDETLYIGCTRGNGMVMKCFNGEFFDADLMECVESSDSTESSTISSSTYSTVASTPTVITEPPNPCAGITNGRIPHPDDCILCQLCILFQLIPFDCRCEDGEVFWINDCVKGDPDTCEPFTSS